MKIAAVFGDRGGFNAGMPVLERAVGLEHRVSLYLSATTKSQWEAHTLPVPSTMNVIYKDNLRGARPDVVLVGSSASVEGTRAACEAIELLQAPALLLEDYLGSARNTLAWAVKYDLPIRRVCVDSSFSRGVLAKSVSWKSDIIVTGAPQWDAMSKEAMGARWDELRDAIRNPEDLPDSCFLFVIAGQLNGTAELVSLAMRGAFIAGMRHPDQFRIIVRQHPRATDLDNALMEHVVLGGTSSFLYAPRQSCGVKKSEDLLPALENRRGLVLSGYSSTLTAACLCGIEAVCAGTPSFRHDFAREKFPEVPTSNVPFPPECENGAAWKATSFEEMADIIQAIKGNDRSGKYASIAAGRERMKRYQDGKATERVLDELFKLVQ